MKITMREVATYANVSVATVSHVINNSRFVKEETRQRVLKAIQELHYSPDISARTLKTGKRNTIGFIVPDICSNFFATAIEAIENALALKNYKLIVVNTHEDPKRELETVKLLASGLVDGLIISSTINDYQYVHDFLKSQLSLPVIFLAREISSCPFDSVTISDYDATFQGIEHLIQKGHRRIGIITGIKHLVPCRERVSAYQDALMKYHLPIDKELIYNAEFHAFDAVEHLLEKGCTALVASTNNVTTDALIYFLNHNIQLGEKISLLGFINDDSTSLQLNKMLQILHPINEMGKQAVSQLLNRLENPEAPIKNIVLMGKFVYK